MKHAFALSIVAAFTLTVPAGAQVAGTDKEEVVNPTAGAHDKVVCRTSKVIGSRLKAAPVCKTQSQWRAEQQESRSAVEKGQNQRTLNGG